MTSIKRHSFVEKTMNLTWKIVRGFSIFFTVMYIVRFMLAAAYTSLRRDWYGLSEVMVYIFGSMSIVAIIFCVTSFIPIYMIKHPALEKYRINNDPWPREQDKAGFKKQTVKGYGNLLAVFNYILYQPLRFAVSHKA